MNHAQKRASERLKFVPNLKTVLEIIKAGKAKLRLSEHDRPIYDVPYEGTTVRVVVNADKSWVLSVLPPEFPIERLRRLDKAKARTRREFYKHFENEDDAVTASRS